MGGGVQTWITLISLCARERVSICVREGVNVCQYMSMRVQGCVCVCASVCERVLL